MNTELEILIRARYPLIWLDTPEEARAVKRICAAAVAQGDAVAGWSHTFGLHDLPGTPEPGSHTDPMAFLEYARKQKRRCVWVLKDLPLLLEHNPALTRALKDSALLIKDRGGILICLSNNCPPPTSLDGLVATYSLPLPDAAAHAAQLTDVARQLAMPVADADRKALSTACLGLTLEQAENIWARVRACGGRFTADDIEAVLAEKQRLVRGSGYLEFVDPLDMDRVGGLDGLKRWLVRRGLGFSDEARRLGLPYPRGVLLVGVQGCGKSLTARAVAGHWKQPLLRMDIGALMEGLVGASENNLRRALTVAERVAPCVLWVDEIEKAFGGMDAGSDGGTALRMFGTMLTWMQEKTQPVFLLATANQIDNLPPEFMRKGRFDEIFFVDLPDPLQRRSIWRVHLDARAKASSDPGLLERIDLGALASLSEGYSGAEIAAAVVEGAFDALAEREPLGGAQIARALKASPPLSKTRAESISMLRRWAEDRARRAG